MGFWIGLRDLLCSIVPARRQWTSPFREVIASSLFFAPDRISKPYQVPNFSGLLANATALIAIPIDATVASKKRAIASDLTEVASLIGGSSASTRATVASCSMGNTTL